MDVIGIVTNRGLADNICIMRLLTMAYEEVMNEIADRASVILIPYVLLILIIDTTDDLNSVCEIEHLTIPY